MLLTSIDPFVQEFDRLAQRVFSSAFPGRSTSGFRADGVMPMDVIRRGDEVVLRLDLPGIDPQTIDLTVDRDMLTINAQRPEEYGEGEKPFIRERVMGTFSRRVYLADALDSDKIEASYHNGVLTVRVPLAERARARKIEISAGGKKALKD